MRSVRVVVPILFGVLLITAVEGKAQDRPLRAGLDSLFIRWNNPDTPGCAAGVDLRGAPIARVGYGRANLEHAAPWTSRTPGYIGSTSKQFQAFTVLLLASRGLLSLDDDVRTHLPELPTYDHTITLRHLLHHMSGIPDFPGILDYAGFGRERPYGDEEISRLLLRQKRLLFVPGTEVAYSTSGYWLLSLVVERVLDRAWGAVARTEIFEPLEMRTAFVHDDFASLVPGRSTAYESASDDSYRIFERAFATNASIYMSVDDLLLWAANFSHERVGGSAVLTAMVSPGVLSSGDTIPEAAGLVLDDYEGHRLVAHNGRNAGHSAELLRFPALDLSIAVLCNVRQASAARFALRIADLALPIAGSPQRRSQAAGEPPVAASEAAELPRTEEPMSESPSAEWSPSTAELGELSGAYVRGENVFRLSAPASPVGLERIQVWFNGDAEPYGLERTEAGTFRLIGAGADPSETLEFVKPESDGERSLLYRSGTGAGLRFIRVPVATGSDLAGVGGSFYSPELDVTYAIRLDNLHLEVKLDSQHASQIFDRGLYYLGDLTWADGGGRRITFDAGGSGSATMTVWDDRVGAIAFQRVSEP